MSGFKLDDQFHSQPKVIAAGNAAIGLYCRLGTYCADKLTDGFVADAVARSMGTVKELKALTTCPIPDTRALLDVVPGGYLIARLPPVQPEPGNRARRARQGEEPHGQTPWPFGRSFGQQQANERPNLAQVRRHPTPTLLMSTSQITTTTQTLGAESSSVDLIAQAWAEHIASEALVPPRNHERFVAGTKRNLLNERRADIERTAHLEQAAAIDVLLGHTTLPPRQAWYANPECQACEGDGLALTDDDRWGACQCRRAEPYEALATIHQLREEIA